MRRARLTLAALTLASLLMAALAAPAAAATDALEADAWIGGISFGGGAFDPDDDCQTGQWVFGPALVEGRCALEFDISGVPSGATIHSATLSIRRSPSPFTCNGPGCMVDLAGYAGNGTGELADLGAGSGLLTFEPSPGFDVQTHDVTAFVGGLYAADDDWAGFRLSRNADSMDFVDSATWSPPGSDDAPSLTIVYSTPDDLAQLVLVKDAGGRAEEFAFETGAKSAFELSEGAPSVTPFDFALLEGVESVTSTFTEILSAEQLAGGWTFVEVSCANAADPEWSDWTSGDATLAVTVRAGDDITCTWVNALPGASPTTPSPTPTESPATAELPDTATASSPDVTPILTLIAVLAAVALVATRSVRKAR